MLVSKSSFRGLSYFIHVVDKNVTDTLTTRSQERVFWTTWWKEHCVDQCITWNETESVCSSYICYVLWYCMCVCMFVSVRTGIGYACPVPPRLFLISYLCWCLFCSHALFDIYFSVGFFFVKFKVLVVKNNISEILRETKHTSIHEIQIQYCRKGDVRLLWCGMKYEVLNIVWRKLNQHETVVNIRTVPISYSILLTSEKRVLQRTKQSIPRAVCYCDVITGPQTCFWNN